MRKGFLLFLFLGFAQNVLGQFVVLEDSSDEFDESSGQDPDVFLPDDMIPDKSDICTAGYGYQCGYPQLSFDPMVPKSQWKDVIPMNWKRCSILGGPTTITFDRALTHYRGSCEVLMFRACGDNSESVEVWVTQSKECDYCITKVTLTLGKKELILSDEITLDGSPFSRELPSKFWTDENQVESAGEISRRGSFIKVSFGDLELHYHITDSHVALSVPQYLARRACGLCGSTDGQMVNEFTDVENTPSNIKLRDSSCRNEIPPAIPIDDRCMKLESTLRMCNILISNPFEQCLSYADPTPFYQLCLTQVCSRDRFSEENLLCNVTKEYSRECAMNFGHPLEWRSLANCVEQCPIGMEWSECVDPLRTCEAHASGEASDTRYFCQPGCHCPKGKYMQNGECVTAEVCKCEMDGNFYGPGEVVQMQCNNTCSCLTGRWSCTHNKCSGVAAARGLFRYVTFDGQTFTHPDRCTFVLAKDCGGKEFSVLVSHEERDGVFYSYPTIVVQEGNERHAYILRRDGRIGHKSIIVNEPLKTGLVDIHRVGSSVTLKIVGKNVHVTYDRIVGVSVHVPSSYMNKMCGLGGNFNGIMNDDYRLRSNFLDDNVTRFANDWKTEKSCVGAIPNIEPTTCDSEAIGICKKLHSHTHCNGHMKAAEMCQTDVCSLPTSEVQFAFACSSVRTFITWCLAKDRLNFNVPLDLGEECQEECPSGKTYRESSNCRDSCASLSSLCTAEIYAGCFCPPGKYQNQDGDCVPQEECHCLFDGTWYEPGKVTSIPNSECSCYAGEMTCIEKNGTISCPSPDMRYYSCEDPDDIQGAACENTCEDLDSLCMAGSCMTGCACKSGLYRTPEGSCVPKEECGCFAGDKYYKHGESYTDDCNTVTCSGGRFTSTDLVCPRTCWAVGASHYHSFDGQRFDFEGDCEYILATDYCPNNPKGGLFSIHIKNARCGSSGMTCSKSIVISVKNQKITLERGRDPMIETIAGTRFRRAITGFTDHSKPETFTIKQKGIFTVIDTCIGMTILWDKGTRVYIRLTAEYSGTTCGLCGNFDGSDQNDFTMSNGMENSDLLRFANSWKFPPLSKSCLDSTLDNQINATCSNVARKEWSIEKCRVITDKDGLFAACHDKVDPQAYFDICVYDACGCDGGGDCECLCTAIAHYAHVCANKGVPVEWRSNDLCPIMCEEYNDDEDVCLWHYRPCATCITDTCCDCQQPEDTHWCVEGCFPKCPAGYILDEMTQRCIKSSQRDGKCTWFSTENICHTCEKCEVCKTASGAVLRVQPGEVRYFPLTTDMCEREWCAMDTTGDLCYNGTIDVYDCSIEYPIPSFDSRYYTQRCWNTSKSECENCRECEQECKVRNDSCEIGKTPGSQRWRKVFPILPTPERGAKTYCMEYSCEYHPEATEPQCDIQREERVVCKQSIDEVVCKDHEVLVIYPTGDECCPEKYECVCDVCEYRHDGIVEYVKTIQPNETQEKCEDESVSNCCYTDTCIQREPGKDKSICHVMTRTQVPCTTGPAPTCSPGFVWKNFTRTDDCCPWGECECDACYDYDAFNNRVLKLLGDTWNKKCMRFTCERGVRDATGCYETKNFKNITCAKEPECKPDEHVVVVGVDEWQCCDIFDCVCNEQCHVTIGGSRRVLEVGQEFQMDDGCYYKCIDPSGDENCPRPEKICYPPIDCQECEFVADTVNDTCGCPKYECQTEERCPSIDCPFPYVRVVDLAADKCKQPCYDCECKECWDQYQNRTYKVGNTWRRQFLEPAKCEDCECTDVIDDDGCLKETCSPRPCPPVEECESPYDTAITGKNECGCTILLGCVCPYCSFLGKVVDGKKIGDRWTVGDVRRGCFDSYECLTYKTPGSEKECYNVTKVRNPCPEIEECGEDFISVLDDEASCSYDDGEYCARYGCTCVKCRFDDKSYDPGDTWTKDCVNYVCTNETDLDDPARCKKIESEVVQCPVADLNCQECYVEYLKQERQVPDYCCDEWACKPELFCVNEFGERVANGSVWKPNECKRVQCLVSEEEFKNGTCPKIVEIDHCDPDPRVCNECQNRTIVKDECGCDKVECPSNDKPVSCKNPAENQKLDYFNTDNTCYPSKNCCVCDDACYYKGARKGLFSVWWDEETCTRQRCVLPEATLRLLGFDPDNVFFEDLNDFSTWSQLQSELNFRKMLSDTGIARSLYSECSQDVSLCPVVYDIGCPKPVECDECEHTTETVDKCGCPVLECTPYVCPPEPWNVEECTEPKAVKQNISLQGLTDMYPCCKYGSNCICREGCLDKDGNLRAVGEVWDEEGENSCGKTLTKKTCLQPSEFDDPQPECPQEKIVPCPAPTSCRNCENRTSYIDEYCCEIASCSPLNEPNKCTEPGENQRISALETGDECFPSKNCCVCDTVCTYKGRKYQLFEVWEDEESCTRMRCILPETTIRALGYEGKIDYTALADADMELKFTELKSTVDYRRMMQDSKISEKLYESCQQEISLCPTSIDIGCKPVNECPECHTTNITQDKCGCDVSTCTEIPRCEFLTCPFPKQSREIADSDPCKAPCYECACDHVCQDNFDNRTYTPFATWQRRYRNPVRKCETCSCTTDRDEEDGCMKEDCTPTPCPVVDECEAPYNKPIYGEDECGCTVLIECECTQCMYSGEVLPNRKSGDTWTDGDVDRGCYDTYHCEHFKAEGKKLECFNVTKKRADCMVDPECPIDHVPVKNENKSCCFDGTCCPRYDCDCVKCRLDGQSYEPGEKWTKDCIVHTCTNITDEKDPDKCYLITQDEYPCEDIRPECVDCEVEYLEVERKVPDDCCNIWGCRPEKVCIRDDGVRVSNGTVWEPEPCKRLLCFISDEDWNNDICPAWKPIDHCDEDKTVCGECTNKTIVKDECECDKIECPPNNPPVHCAKPGENQLIEFFNNDDTCSAGKNCCVCDSGCYYKGARYDILAVWLDESSCQRMRCVLPDVTLRKLGINASTVQYEDLKDYATWRKIQSSLNYGKMLRETGVHNNVYGDCSQDTSLCPVAREIGCPEVEKCEECHDAIESIDECGCPVVSCSPYICPPSGFDNAECSEPKSLLVNVTLLGRSDRYPCCPWGYECQCQKGCIDTNGTLREIGEVWDESGTNECGKTLIRKKCVPASESGTECPQAVDVPCAPPTSCGKCENRTSYIDEYCCEIASCKPLDEPVMCRDPAENQRVSSLETGDECFPSKNCCVCDTTCNYNGGKYQLFEVWKDASTCTRSRCVLPEPTIRALGYEGTIDYKDLTNAEMSATFIDLKARVDYRMMMLETKASQKLYAECQQDTSLCPAVYDMGCEPVETCPNCSTTTIYQDECGCDVAECVAILPCAPIVCAFPFRRTEIKDVDPCKAPCYECTCDHICVDNVTKSAYEPDAEWNRTILEPRSCETCQCTNEKDTDDGCLKELCKPIQCPAVDKCNAPYDKATYGTDDCGCTILISCECTRCMYEGEIVANRSRGDFWTEGDVERGCFDTYSCEATKGLGKELECYVVTKERKPCIEDPECPENHVAVADEERTCCFDDDICCPRHTCECVKCRFKDEVYSPGETWSENCIDYTCTNLTDETDPKKCKKVSGKPFTCPEERTECNDCYIEMLTTTRNVSAGECCNIWGCVPEKVCIKEDGTRVPNGTIWMPDKCTRLMCYVSEEEWEKGTCPTPTPITPCINDLSAPCPPCTNKTIIKDECDCDSVSCPPVNKVMECTEPAAYQVLTTLETGDSCQPSKNCCICDDTCLYKGSKKELFSVWIDEATCMRMRCVPSESLLMKLGYDAAAVDFADVENDDLWREMRSKIDFRRFIAESKTATKLYDQCSQDASLCPTAKSIGCPVPDPCPNCTNEINTKDACGCPIRHCVPYDCPPGPFDVNECFAPKTKLVEISLKDRSDKYPCCLVGRECVCEETCFDYLNNSRAISEEWDEPKEYVCDSDPTVKGSVIRKRCNPPASAGKIVDLSDAATAEESLALLSRDKRTIEKDETVCPYDTIVPCEEPITCKPCEETVSTVDERCCVVVTCKKIECEINKPEDCTLPKIAMRSDAAVTGDECCPKYCDCPYECTESETGAKYDRNIVWPHPLNSCFTRTCLVDALGLVNAGCPYIANNTVCTEPQECDVCNTAIDSEDSCGCTTRTCEKNPCPKTTCDDECDEVYETGDLDDCGCPVLDCRPKPCPVPRVDCDDPEKSVYSWMDLSADKCCKQYGCRCNYTKCAEPKCAPGLIPVRNVSAIKCCCPEYTCVPDSESQCVDYNGIPRKVGVPWINKDNHCKMLQCTYSSAKKSSYKIEEFDRFTCFNEKPICVNGGLPYLASTKEGCCSEWVCPCTCQVYGDPHFTTFDGKSYDYQGKCTYTLMKEYAFNQTEVIVDNELCRWQSARRKSLSCLKTMTVLHRGVNYTFTFGMKFLRNGKEHRARNPWVSEDGDVTVREFGYKRLKLEISSLRMEILYKTRLWSQSLILTIPYESLEGKMLGLCGSCNNDPGDDFRDKAMNIVAVKNEYDYEMIDKFGEGWIQNVKDYDEPKCFPVEPACPEEPEFPNCGEHPPDECISCDNKCHLSHPKCHPCEVDPCKVLRTNEVYREANLIIDPRTYEAKCAYDLSLESNVTRKCDPCFSPSVAQYATMLELQGACVAWRSALGCPDTVCPPTQEYRACDLDAKRDLSCDLPVLNITASVNVEGCFCPEGTIRRSATSEECIPLKCCNGCSEPPTCEDGSVALAGDKTDDCGCPIYMCSDVEGCQVQTVQQLLEITISGKKCSSPGKVVNAGCTGNCAVSTKSVDGGFEASCSRCNPTSTSPRSVTLECEDGTTENYEYDVITACECASSSCSESCR